MDMNIDMLVGCRVRIRGVRAFIECWVVRAGILELDCLPDSHSVMSFSL